MLGISRERTINCLQIMLGPICRFCAQHTIHLNDIIEALKRAMVKAAQEEVILAGKTATASRIKAVCGLHRREIVRLLSSSEVKEGGEGLITRIIGQWQNDKRYCSRPGKPKLLTFAGPKSEFAKLVGSVSHELKSGTILFELERQGVVTRQGEKVKLDTQTYAPVGNVEHLMVFLAKDTADLMDAVTENIFDPQTPANLHATTEYDNINPAALKDIRKWLLAQGKEFHKKARSYLSKHDRDILRSTSQESRGVRVAIGTFGLVRKKIEDGEK